MIRLLILYNITNILSSVREHMTIVIHLIDIVSSLGLKSPLLSSISIATYGHRQSLSDKRNMCTCDSIIEKIDIRYSTSVFLLLIKRRVGDAES